MYGIKCGRADNVSRNTLELLDILDSIHWLDPEIRKFVQITVFVHDTGVTMDFENHHNARRNNPAPEHTRRAT